AFGALVDLRVISQAVHADDPLGIVAQIVIAGVAFTFTNFVLGVSVASLRTGTPFGRIWSISISNVLTGLVALVPLGWLMAEIAVKVGLWASFLLLVPPYLARCSFTKYAETRELVCRPISARSQATTA